jgi:hypothetical protein
MRRRQSDPGFTWRAVENPHRRAIAASVLAISCALVGFIGGRLSILVFPPSSPAQLDRVAMTPPASGPPSYSENAEVAGAPPLLSSEPSGNEARTEATPVPAIVINADGAEAEENLPKKDRKTQTQDQTKSPADERRARQNSIVAERTVSGIQSRACDYSELRRYMLGR